MITYDTELQEELNELRRESPLLWEFVIQRATEPTNTKALAKINRTEQWLWQQPLKAEVEALATRLRLDAPQHALTLLQQAATKAAQNMLDLAENAKDERVKFQANKDIMDRLGMRAPDKLQIEAGTDMRTWDEVITQVFGEMARKKQLQAGDVIDGVLGDVTEADE